MNNTQKEYIEQNIDLIESNDWHKFFNSAPGGIAEVLLSAGIDFLTHMSLLNGKVFYQCFNINTIYIPSNIRQINGSAFESCGHLKNVYIEDIHSWCNIEFGIGISTPVYYSKGIKLKETDEYITNVDIPASIHTLKFGSFTYNDKLERIHIPKTVKHIEGSAISFCGHIDIVYDGTKDDWINLTKGKYIFTGTTYTCTCSNGVVKKYK